MAAKNSVDNFSNSQKIKYIVETSIKNANAYVLKRNYGRAFAHYLLIFKLDPIKKELLKNDFTYVMREWTEDLERQNRIEDLFKCYEQACDVFPECETALNNIGAQLFRLGYMDEGALYIRKAIRLAPNYVAARQNLENICNYLVDRWHFRMLNDTVRNLAYKAAIEKAALRGANSILDIGAGTGLLSLYAVESGIQSVYACEKSKTMHDVAKDVLAKNDGNAKIKLMCKSSTDVQIGEDIPERVDLIVTETFDAGLFGEHILSTLSHAFKNLVKPDQIQQIIPGEATVYISAIEAESIRNKNRFLYPVLQNVDLNNIHIVCKTTLTDDDPYTTEDLSSIRGGYVELSSPCQLLSINFNNSTEIERFCNGLDFQKTLNVTKTGRLDAIVLWFDLHLDDEITITTRPDVANCWEQTVYPVLPQHFIKQGGCPHLAVKMGEEIVLNYKLDNNLLNLVDCDIKQTHSTSNNNLQKSEMKTQTNSLSVFKLEQSEIDNLNDLNTNRVFFQAIERLRLAKNMKNLSMMDCCQGLSPLGLQAAILGYSDVCVACDEDKMDYIVQLGEVNHIRDKVSVINRDRITCSEERYDVITCDLIESCGVFKQQILQEMALMRVASLRDHGIILPQGVKVYGICVESDDLLRVSRVISNEKTSGYQIAEFINDFQSTTHVDIDLHTLRHSKLSESFLIFDFSMNNSMNLDYEPAAFFEQTSFVDVNILESGSVTAIIYWFELIILDELKVSSLDYTSHWKQAGLMVKKSVDVIEGEKMKLEFHLENSCIELKSLNKS